MNRELRQLLDEYQAELREIYEKSVEELTEDYKGVVMRAGLICYLVGILFGLGLATAIEVIFK